METVYGNVARRLPVSAAAGVSPRQSQTPTKWITNSDSAGGSLRCDFGVQSDKELASTTHGA